MMRRAGDDPGLRGTRPESGRHGDRGGTAPKLVMRRAIASRPSVVSVVSVQTVPMLQPGLYRHCCIVVPLLS